MVYYLRHPTGRFRLCKKPDGSYVLQDEWIDENQVIKEEINCMGNLIKTYKTWWEDRETFVEKEFNNVAED